MSDTPRSDYASMPGLAGQPQRVVDLNYARTLERELNATTAKLELERKDPAGLASLLEFTQRKLDEALAEISNRVA